MSTKPVSKKNRKTKPSKKYIPAPVKESDISTTQFYILKWIACITMLVDTVAYFFQEQCHIPPDIYVAMRCVGRISFPLFGYLLVESFRYTERKKKHVIRIVILALVSELPFDIVYITENGIISFEHQNVCFTLFLALLCLMINDKSKGAFEKLYEKQNFKKIGKVVVICFNITIVGIFALIANTTKTDFGFSGILFIALTDFAKNKKFRIPIMALAFILFGLIMRELPYLTVIVPFILICLFERYHKKHKNKGKAEIKPDKGICSKFSRRLAFIFYPLHFILLIIIRFVMS